MYLSFLSHHQHIPNYSHPNFKFKSPESFFFILTHSPFSPFHSKNIKYNFKMRIHPTAILAELVLAFCARAAPSDLPISSHTFPSNTSIVGNTTTSNALPYSNSNTNTTAVFCKRDGSSCSVKTQTPRVVVEGMWDDLDESEAEDIDYFRFSGRNIVLSRADDWYVPHHTQNPISSLIKPHTNLPHSLPHPTN